MGNPKRFYTGQDFAQLNLSLDRFQAILDNKVSVKTNSVSVLSVRGTYSHVESIEHSYVGAEQTVNTNIENPLEGDQLEKEIYVVLRSLFTKDAYHNPFIRTKTGYRELIDIFAISAFGVFLIEAKALGVYESVDGRTMERKVLGLQKQIKKAVAQLVGASKTLAGGTKIFSAPDREILFDRTFFPNGIVLVSEMFPFGDWDSTIRLVIDTMADCKMFVHVLDLKELLQFIGHSNNDRNIFDDLLMQRVKKFVEHPTLLVRSEFHEK
ncbi:MAG: NERD domain-containing protein [Pedobacter sp.]|nr:MAG: NERD domain-containing protein [Pedobacter sp.]